MDRQRCGTTKFPDACRQLPGTGDGAIITPINEPTEQNAAKLGGLGGEKFEEPIPRLTACKESLV